MTTADKLTASRIVLAPVFFLTYFSHSIPDTIVVASMWVLFVVMEVTDLLDGLAARRSGTVSAFGKLFDPFADVVSRITYFICFAASGLMPLWILLLIVYREFGILFLRMLFLQKGITMGARPGGKAKAVFYMIAGIISLIIRSLEMLGWMVEFIPSLRIASLVVYLVAVALALFSFGDYVLHYRVIAASSK